MVVYMITPSIPSNQKLIREIRQTGKYWELVILCKTFVI